MLDSFSFCEKWIYEESFFNVVALLLSDEEGRLFKAKQLPAFLLITENLRVSLATSYSVILEVTLGISFNISLQGKRLRALLFLIFPKEVVVFG